MIDDKYPHDHTDLQVVKSELATLKSQYAKLDKEHNELRAQINNRIWAFFIFAGSGVVALLAFMFGPILKQ